MKAAVEVGPSSITGGVENGRVGKRRDVENEEIQMYLSKLKDLVPFMPKNKKLSKLEVIRHVIEYICELQYALESHPTGGVDPAELTARLQAEAAASPRQPLGTLAPSPNTIMRPCTSPLTSSPDLSPGAMSPDELDITQETDIRPISCQIGRQPEKAATSNASTI